MKCLILIRHAKSSWKQALPDLQRPLNKRGRRNAPLMARRLAAELSGTARKADMLISSPAERAMCTARAFAGVLGIPSQDICAEAGLYHDDHRSMLERIRAFDDALETVVWFGHNPELTILAEMISGAEIDNVPTCGVCWIEFATDTWREAGAGNGHLKWFDYPKRQPSGSGSGAAPR